MPELVLFVIFATVALAGALLMVVHPNPVYGALGLMAAMFAVAVFYVVLNGHFIAAVQVIVYAGAVMTLFLFVIMLIGVDRAQDLKERLPLQRPLTVLAGVGLLVVLGFAARESFVVPAASGGEANGTVEAIADLIFNEWLLPFELTTLLLVIASVGAVALAKFSPEPRDE